MRFFDREKEDPEEKLERVSLENRIEVEKSETLEKRLLQKHLKQKFGRNWRSMIGNAKDNDTMRQFASFGSGFDIASLKQNNRDVPTGERRRVR